MNAPKTQANDSSRAGQLASRRVYLGDWDQYAVYAVHTRFDRITWMVEDAEQIDPETDTFRIVGQGDDYDTVVAPFLN